MPVISFANMKGGVGKSTLCVNLAFDLLLSGKKVLVVDNDPQFNATSTLLRPERYIEEVIRGGAKTIYDIYEKPPRVSAKRKGSKGLKGEDVILTRWWLRGKPKIRLDLIPSRIELYETLRSPAHKEYLLDNFLTKYAREYDYVFVDCPPTPSILTFSAFAASDYVIIPVQPTYYSTLGLPQFLGTLDEFKDDLHDSHDVSVLGVLFTNVPRRHDPEVTKSMERVMSELRRLGDDIPVFKSRMRNFKVYEKTLWWSLPVHEISGRGTRGKSEATTDLGNIRREMEALIASRAKGAV